MPAACGRRRQCAVPRQHDRHRLDFTQAERIDATYQEHAKILRAVLQRKSDQAQLLIKTHIEGSKAEVRKITLHMLHTARPASA